MIVVGGGWDGGPGPQPLRPAKPTLSVIRCPVVDCQSHHVRIRSSTAQISYLECEVCGESWKICDKITRILAVL